MMGKVDIRFSSRESGGVGTWY